MPRLLPFLVLVFSAQSVMSLAFHSPGVFAPVVAASLGVPAAMIGPYTAASSLCSALGGLALSGLVRRTGGIRSLQVALSGIAAALFVAATGEPFLVAFSAAILGFFGGLLPASTVHLIGRAAPPERVGVIFAINQCSIPLGSGLGGLLIPFLVGRIDWQASACLIGALVFAMVAYLSTKRAAIDTDRDPSARITGATLIEPIRLVWSHPVLRSLSLVALVYMGMQIATLSYLVSYLKLEIGTTFAIAGAAFTAAQIGSIVTRLGLGWFADRSGHSFRALGAMGVGTAVLSLVLASATPGWPLAAIFVVAALQGMFSLGWTALYFATLSKVAPEGKRASAMAGSQVLQMVGALGGPVLFAAIASWGGSMALAFAVLGTASLATGLWLLAASRRQAAV